MNDTAAKFAIPMVFASILAGVLFGFLFAKNAPLAPMGQGVEWLTEPVPIPQFSSLLPNPQGKARLVVFGYLSCPDVCPTTLSELASLLSLMQTTGAEPEIEVVFISVDPERDERADLQQYVARFDSAFVATTSSHQQLKSLNHSLGVDYRIPQDRSAFYLVSHSPIISLVTGSGDLVGRIRPGFDRRRTASQLLQRLTSAF